MSEISDMIGKKFNKLLVLSENPQRSLSKEIQWNCKCDCGNLTVAIGSRLRHGRTKSCGCFNYTMNGASGTPEYIAWRGALQRCYSPTSDSYSYYGARGITMCDRWKNSFHNFILDMGYRPSPKHSLDRYPDQNGNYEPGNCRWATTIEQHNNKRNNDYREYNGEIKTVAQLAREKGLLEQTLRKRLAAGHPIKNAVESPLQRKVVIAYNGQTKTLTEWSLELGIAYNTLYTRINVYGWDVDKAFTEKVANGQQKFSVSTQSNSS